MEFSLAAGSEADVKLLKELGLDLPEGSIIHADKGYTDYHYEELLKEVGLHLKAQRKKRSRALFTIVDHERGSHNARRSLVHLGG